MENLSRRGFLGFPEEGEDKEKEAPDSSQGDKKEKEGVTRREFILGKREAENASKTEEGDVRDKEEKNSESSRMSRRKFLGIDRGQSEGGVSK